MKPNETRNNLEQLFPSLFPEVINAFNKNYTFEKIDEKLSNFLKIEIGDITVYAVEAAKYLGAKSKVEVGIWAQYPQKKYGLFNEHPIAYTLGFTGLKRNYFSPHSLTILNKEPYLRLTYLDKLEND